MVGGWRNVLLGGRRINTSNSFWAYNARYAFDRHTGVDFSAGTGTPINAPIGGKVVEVSTSGAYGKTVVIRMPDGYYMRFAHMSSMNVSKGQTIKAGQLIGKVGSTGASTGAHLHLEVMTPASGGKYGRSSFVDPIDYLNGRKTAARADKSTETERTTRDEPSGSDAAGAATSTSYVTGDGGWGKMAATGFNKKDFYAALSAMYGDIDVLMALDKENNSFGGKSIKWAIDQMVKQKIVDSDRALTILKQTGWFKQNAEETTRRLVAERERPGVFKESVAQFVANMRQKFDSLGISVSDEVINSMARNAYVYQWTDDYIIDEVQKSAFGTTGGGQLAEAEDELTAFADDYGVSLSEADLRQLRNDILDGAGTQGVRELIQAKAAQTYGIWAEQIKAGQSTRALASAYFDRAAQLLEVDPNSIEWDDPLFVGGKAFTTTDQATGGQAQKGLWDFEKEIRQDSRWMKTKNAQDEVMGKATGILKTMGLI